MANETASPLFFWKVSQAYGEFCQWYPSIMKVSNSEITALVGEHLHSDKPDTTARFNCCEQFMMYCKAARFGDLDAQLRIMKCSAEQARKMKVIGGQAKGFDEDQWTEIKSRVVETGNYLKFKQSGSLRALLLGTGERELCEASPYDRVWGIGFKAGKPEERKMAMSSREDWGENRLGKALMVVRERLRNGERQDRKGERADDTTLEAD